MLQEGDYRKRSCTSLLGFIYQGSEVRVVSYVCRRLLVDPAAYLYSLRTYRIVSYVNALNRTPVVVGAV
jgi:hypothetical protein